MTKGSKFPFSSWALACLTIWLERPSSISVALWLDAIVGEGGLLQIEPIRWCGVSGISE